MNAQRTYFGYARVSTVKQGEHGVSLEAQRDAIQTYATREGLEITQWFEERVTAAKQGRPAFNMMVGLLRARKAAGAIVHKIDRSARNFHDWALLGDLIDAGVDIRFAHDAVDLQTRGGRLAADLMAVVAADFIRNQREEVKKGLRGRLKQGIYPFRAPLGYLDRGGGRVKEPDPATAALVRLAFELYGSGDHTLQTVCDELERQGLRTRTGATLSITRLAEILRNPFYAGVIRIFVSGETYAGAHEPLVPMQDFERVQARMDGRLNARPGKHDPLFRRMLRCAHCAKSPIGERQKGRVYYRCHTRGCPTTTAREDAVEEEVLSALKQLVLSEADAKDFRAALQTLRETWTAEAGERAANLHLRETVMQDRLHRLTDAYVEHLIDRESFLSRKEALLREQQALAQERDAPKRRPVPERMAQFLELAQGAWSLYRIASHDERRQLLDVVTSNRLVAGRNVDVMLAEPFRRLAAFNNSRECGDFRNETRTLDDLFLELETYFKTEKKTEEAQEKYDAMMARLPPGEVHDVHRVHEGRRDAA